MTLVKLERATAPLVLRRVSADRAEVSLETVALRFVEGDQGPPGVQGPPGQNGEDGTLDAISIGGIPVDIAGLEGGDGLIYDPASGKFVNKAPVDVLDGGFF